MPSKLDLYIESLKERAAQADPNLQNAQISDGLAVYEFVQSGLLDVDLENRNAILKILRELKVGATMGRMEIANILNRELDPQNRKSLRACAFQSAEKKIEHTVMVGKEFSAGIGVDIDKLREDLEMQFESELISLVAIFKKLIRLVTGESNGGSHSTPSC